MSMLAGPRQRKKYNLVPRGKALYEDDNRFGTKILEKMGWSKGKGLGTREDGAKDFIRIKYKNDANGFGYEERDDQWTEHEKHFNGLLASLHNSGENSSAEEDELMPTMGFGFQPIIKPPKKIKVKDKISGESLEEKSKNSKSRVHYQKFTRGKDLSQYSEKDLANIFGKKSNDDTIPNAIDLVVHPEPTPEVPDKEDTFGVPTVHTGKSVADYFKQKMEEMKRKRMKTSENIVDSKVVEDIKEECEKPKKKRKKEKILEDENELIEPLKKKKKSKKHKDEFDECTIAHDVAEMQQTFETTATEKESIDDLMEKKSEKIRKKKKKTSDEVIDTKTEEDICAGQEENKNTEINENEIVEKRKKKKKHKRNDTVNDEEDLATTTLRINEVVEMNEIFDMAAAAEELNSDTVCPKSGERKKSKKQKQSAPGENENQSLELTTQSLEHKKSCNEAKSVGDSSKSISNETSVTTIQENDPRKIITINGFHAEIFRNADFGRFQGANISSITGYGLDYDYKLQIIHQEKDIDRITRFWNSKTIDGNATNKYVKNPLEVYAQKAKECRKVRGSLPKIKLKKKSVFLGI